MRWPFSKSGSRQPESPQDREAIRSLFSKFRRIQKLNTDTLEIMAEMDRALGGEYIFDRAFLERSIRDLGALVYQVVYSLNALSNNRYIELFDRFQAIRSTLLNILEGGLGSYALRLTFPLSELGVEMEPLAGAADVCLAEARNRLHISVPDGFVVTLAGCRRFFRANGLDELDAVNGTSLPDRIRQAMFPSDLEGSIRDAMNTLGERRGGPLRVRVRACVAGAYGLEPSVVESREVPSSELLDACRLALSDWVSQHGNGGSPSDFAVALSIHEAVPANLTGSVSSGPAGLLRIGASSTAEAKQGEEVYLVRRVYPFDLVRSDIKPKSRSHEPAPLSRGTGSLRRGSALLGPSFLRTLAETSVAIDRLLGRAHDLTWTWTDSDRLVIDGVSPAPATGDPDADSAGFGDLREAKILLRGGETVQMGVSAGRVVHVDDLTDPAELPPGSIAVARTANPQLSFVLRRAAAIVTETGTPVGHLATIAREMRIPAVFGAAAALERLPEGVEVTVDAGEQTVYAGIVESLLDWRAPASDLFPSDPEYIMLRLLLRFIMPLGMLDPDSSDFVLENCRTYHDIIHFAHERSVEELLQLLDTQRGFHSLHPRRLNAGVPMDLSILDIDGDPAAESGSAMEIKDVTSEPFKAFFSGLTRREMWDTRPASLKFGEIFSNVDRTFRAMSAPAHAGTNLAVLAKNYMNLGLRLGYHFSVLDSHLEENPNQNYVYFRFAGGFGDDNRRRRRAELIRLVLNGMGFKVTVKGDLVVGKFKNAGKVETAAVLTRLGELTAFTRQLDTSMASERRVEEFAQLFAVKSARADAVREGEEPHSV